MVQLDVDGVVRIRRSVDVPGPSPAGCRGAQPGDLDDVDLPLAGPVVFVARFEADRPERRQRALGDGHLDAGDDAGPHADGLLAEGHHARGGVVVRGAEPIRGGLPAGFDDEVAVGVDVDVVTVGVVLILPGGLSPPSGLQTPVPQRLSARFRLESAVAPSLVVDASVTRVAPEPAGSLSDELDDPVAPGSAGPAAAVAAPATTAAPRPAAIRPPANQDLPTAARDRLHRLLPITTSISSAGNQKEKRA